MSGLRVSGGNLRGRKLRVDPGAGVRPTSERARQAYFNIVAARVPDARFLDLYAGSGIFSFEAVSRGAREAVAIDISRRNVAAIERSAKDWDVPVRATATRLPRGLVSLEGAFDLVYVDPPYNDADYGEILNVISTTVPLAEGAVVAIEHRSNATRDLPDETESLQFRKTSRYGNVSISFFDVKDPDDRE